ncbi:MAG: pilus assembly PilX N-terminal domain-containing protein [Pseudomonadota bacterium]
MIRNVQTIGRRGQQSGIALAISIVFLLLLSIAGVTAIQNSTFEQRMTTNMQHMTHAFHYAESGLAKAVQNPQLNSSQYTFANALEEDLCENSSGTATDCADASSGNASTKAYYEGQGKKPPINFSLDAGFANHYFEVTSTGRSGKAVSTHRQGLFLVGPGGDQ